MPSRPQGGLLQASQRRTSPRVIGQDVALVEVKAAMLPSGAASSLTAVFIRSRLCEICHVR
ncbi:MAG: hypothetical protein LUQ50_00705 [Methanospirillum sp.]|uniref:hypothetical protein n=1 Tax=Methanospirillum sp. TaxID=45200 RepID=UPI00236BCF65|nr:hypothetical protein [Methanospirillum sp.]MDD1727572.1 hypothetical protein [Methanospirillum sp.]